MGVCVCVVQKRDARVLVQLIPANNISIQSIFNKVVAYLLRQRSRRVSEQPSSKHSFETG